MKITSIKTRKFIPPQDPFWDELLRISKRIKEETVVVITSKIVSISEGQCIPKEKIKDKDELIISLSDLYLPRNLTPGGWTLHTLKNNILLPASGVDESNASGYYIVWPQNSTLSAKKIWQFLKESSRVKKLGVIITDSHSIPLRRGLVGISLAYYGFQPLKDYRGDKDLFNREMEVSQSNIADSLAAAAVLQMGEGSEQTPIALITDLKGVKFTNSPKKSKKEFTTLSVPLEEDLFKPFLKSVPWEKGGSKTKL